MDVAQKPLFLDLDFAPTTVNLARRDDGSFIFSAIQQLEPFSPSLGSLLDYWAKATPERVFLAERMQQDKWRTQTYAQAAYAAYAIAQGLIERGLDQSKPVMVLSGNSIDHALLMLGCFLADVPIAPISPAYSLMSKDFSKLKYIHDLVSPKLIYVSEISSFQAAIEVIKPDAELVSSNVNDHALTVTPFTDLLCSPTAEVYDRAQKVTGESIAKILFTSGSTGLPKGVINTHKMLCANQQSARQCWPFLLKMPPVLLDWLPWNHTFGGNHNFNMVLRNGGTLYIDGGKPAPNLIDQTIANLHDVSPNIYFNVPAGYAALLPYLEKDDFLAGKFFKNLKLIFYAAAALPQDLWGRLEELAIRHLGYRVLMTSAWGSTETSPLATSAHFPIEKAGNIGVPVPGVEIKLLPSGTKMELRVRGPNVTPGYYKKPDLTRAAFDEEGFYCIGDAGRLASLEEPEKGLIFDGRLAEDFKLNTGTWVHVGALRVAILAACSPILQDAVICGHDRDEVGILVWPNLAVCREIVKNTEAYADLEELLARPELIKILYQGLSRYNSENLTSSTRIARLYVMLEPPSIDENEITDKGYINQRAVLERRAHLVERLFAENSSGRNILIMP